MAIEKSGIPLTSSMAGFMTITLLLTRFVVEGLDYS
jgi:hypothetical protein